jgi:hypothetical protein
MKQKLLLIWGLLMLTMATQAAPVDVNEAKTKALQFISGKHAAARGAVSGTKADVQLAKSAADDSYYVFNVGQQDGFIIVSGDDRAPEILGYSDSGTFDAQNIPSNMAAWLQGYANEIGQLDDTETPAAARSLISVRSEAWTEVKPLIQTKWGQKAPYNNDLSGCVTGCVATAMAQVMYYHRWPQAATTAIPQYTLNYSNGSSKTYNSLSSTTFEWDKMKKVYTGAESSDANAAVAKLMKYCGYSVEMNYGTGSSSANAGLAVNAFKNYFGYDQNVRQIKRNYYTIDEWETIIYEELKNGRPVMYGGSTVSGSGHEFVCDGYDGKGLFHFNWGWNGDFNGYFVIWTANPNGTGTGGSSSKDGYSDDQSAIIGIQTPTGEPAIEDEQELSVSALKVYNNTLTYQRNSVNVNFTVYFYSSLCNNTKEKVVANSGYGLYGDNYSRIIYDDYTNVSYGLGAVYSFDNNYLGISFGSGLEGTYKIVPVYKIYGGDGKWYPAKGSDRYYIEATMTDTELTLRVMPIVDLEVTKVEYTGNKMAGITQEVKVTVKNNGSEYNGKLYLRVNNYLVSGEGVALRESETTDVYFHYVPSSGTNNYNICLSSDGSNSLKTGSQAIVDYSATDNINLDISVDVENKTHGSFIFGDCMDAVVTATNPSTNQVYQGGVSINDIMSYTPITILPGQSVQQHFYINMTVGETYTVQPMQIKGKYFHDTGTPITYTAAEGVEITNADGTTEMAVAEPTMTVPADATSLDLRGNTTVTSLNTTNANPNCLILADATSSLSGKNIIKGATAESIELTDGADFAAPINFTSTAISYERKFTQGTDGKGGGWTTIILPFDVKEVTVDGRKIDWFHSSTDTGKHFWLRELVSDEVGKVKFDYVPEGGLKANTPYIIAVPGDKWGSEWNLTNKTLKFIGKVSSQIVKDAEAETTKEHYSFVGTTKSQALTNVYDLNSDGSKFQLSNNATVAPFRAYFIANNSSSAARLTILSADDQPTAITLPSKEPLMTGDVYTIDGRKVGDSIDRLPKGIYIINGKKVVK